MAEINESSLVNKDETVEFVRDVIREKITFNRKQQRNHEFSKNRLILGELINIEECNEKFIIEALKKLKKKTLNVKDYKKLQNAFIQNESNINTYLKVDGAVFGFRRDLSGFSSQSKFAAASCCCNLALGNYVVCTRLCKFTSLYLIAELESSSEYLVEICAWTIGNLVRGSDKAFSILHAQNCIKSLIRVAQQCSNSLLPALSYAFLRYIYKRINFIEIEDIIKLNKIMVTRYPSVSDEDTMWLLAILSSVSKCNQYINKCVPEVCEFFCEAVFQDNKNISKISAALRIISNTISEPTGQIAHHVFSNDIEKNCTFLDKLLCHPYIHIRQETLWLLGNLYNHCLDTVQQIIRPVIYLLPSLKLAINSLNKTS